MTEALANDANPAHPPEGHNFSYLQNSEWESVDPPVNVVHMQAIPALPLPIYPGPRTMVEANGGATVVMTAACGETFIIYTKSHGPPRPS